MIWFWLDPICLWWSGTSNKDDSWIEFIIFHPFQNYIFFLISIWISRAVQNYSICISLYLNNTDRINLTVKWRMSFLFYQINLGLFGFSFFRKVNFHLKFVDLFLISLHTFLLPLKQPLLRSWSTIIFFYIYFFLFKVNILVVV